MTKKNIVSAPFVFKVVISNDINMCISVVCSVIVFNPCFFGFFHCVLVLVFGFFVMSCRMHEMQTIVTDDHGVCLSVCPSVTQLNSASLYKNGCSRSCLG